MIASELLHITTVCLAFVISSLFRVNRCHHTWIRILVGGVLGSILSRMHTISTLCGSFPPDLFMALFYPTFIVKLMYVVDPFIYLKSWHQIVLLTLTGSLCIVSSVGFFISYVEKSTLTVITVVVAGLSFAIYDLPVLTENVDGVKNLRAMCDGEAILSGALVIITLQVTIGIAGGYVNTWYHICMVYLRYTAISVILGFVFGNLLIMFYKIHIDDAISAVIASISSSYLIFSLCEHVLFCSGTVTVAITIYYIAKDRPRLTVEVDNEITFFINQAFDILHAVTIIYITAFLINLILDILSPINILVAICAYVIARVLRLFQVLMLTPIISRLGYGFDFTSFITTMGATRNGCGSLIVILMFEKEGILESFDLHVDMIMLIFTFFSYLVNDTVIRQVLNKYKLLELPNSMKINISAGLNVMVEKQVKMITILKMNRFFSDANWPMITECTKLVNPFNIQMDRDGQSFGIREMTCTSCLQKIFVEPTKKELREMSRDAHFKVLKAIRLALLNQYEHGMLGVKEIKLLTQSVESAYNTDDLFIKLDELYRLFKVPRFTEKIKRILLKLQMKNFLRKPEKPFRAFCYTLFTSLYFQIFFHFAIALQITLVIAFFFILNKYYQSVMFFTIVCVDILCVCEIFIKVIGYSTTTFREGCKKFMRGRWNKIDVITLLISMCGTLFGAIHEFVEMPREFLVVVKLARLTRLARIFKLMGLCGNLYPKFVDFCDNRIELKISYAFNLAMAIIIAYDDVIEQLDTITDTPMIRENIKIRLENDKTAVIEYIGTIVRRRPWVPIKVETKQAVLGTLKRMELGIHELKAAGYVDEYEYGKLKTSLEKHYKTLTISNYNQFISPKQVFSEVYYLCNDTESIDFLYEDVTTKIWNAGDIICDFGSFIEGIYILITGMFKVTYIPNAKSLQRLAKEGLLPIKDFLTNARFTEEQTEFVMVGNTVGELSVLTGREYSCQIVSYTSSQAFIIPKKRIWDAIEKCKDPVNGLSPRIWKYLCQHLVKKILMGTPEYHSIPDDNLNYILDKAIVPELGAFKSIFVCDLIEDIVLVEGILIDSNTRFVYKAPCYIPRSVTHLLLPKYSDLNFDSVINVRVMIIPFLNADEYELVLRMEQNSDTLTNAPSRLLVTNNRSIQQRRKRKAIITTRTRSSGIHGYKSANTSQISLPVIDQQTK